ncbi:MAG: thioredoxin family protein [Bacteroidota bacterium]
MEATGQDTMEITTKEVLKESLKKAMSYNVYRDMVHQLAAEGKTTGPNQTEALINYTQLNSRRIKRWDKTLKIDEDAALKIRAIAKKMTWLVLTESWCGDASPSMPVMNKVAELSPNIHLKIVLRDENLELMNRFLTNNAMSIPKLIAIDDDTQNVIGEWGPRPSIATGMVEDYKREHGALTPDFKQDLQVWYNKDKGQNTLKNLLELLEVSTS